MAGVTYDAGALIAAQRNDRRMWALHAGFLAGDVVPVVPAGVLAQVWRGGPRQAGLVRMLVGCEIEVLDEGGARRVGTLAAKCHVDDVVDLSVVEGAVRRGDQAVVTADPSDIARIAAAAGRPLHIEVV